MFIPQLGSAQKAKISLEDLFKKGTFRARSVYGLTSMNDGEHYSAYNAKRQVARFSYATGDEISVLFNPTEFTSTEDMKEFGGYHFSPAEDKMLIETKNDFIYRHSYTSNNYIYDLKSKTLTPLPRMGHK
jgi:dipeptidyl-peptidase-4